MKNITHEVLNFEINVLLETIKKEVQDQNELNRILDSIEKNDYRPSSKLSTTTLQAIINVETLLHSDPISVMGLVNNINLNGNEIKVFQKNYKEQLNSNLHQIDAASARS